MADINQGTTIKNDVVAIFSSRDRSISFLGFDTKQVVCVIVKFDRVRVSYTWRKIEVKSYLQICNVLNPFRLSFSEPKCAPGRHILFLESIFCYSP